MLESSAVSRQAHPNGSESAIGTKREQSTSGSDSKDKGPPSKRAKMHAGAEVETIGADSINLLFRKFVNNALDERATVSFLIQL